MAITLGTFTTLSERVRMVPLRMPSSPRVKVPI
jgi:hypothetical protein